MFGMFFFLTQFLQTIMGFSPLRAGVAFLPMTVALFAVSRLAPRLMPLLGPKPLMITGMVPAIASMAWLSRVSPETGYWSGIFGPMVLVAVPALAAIVLFVVWATDQAGYPVTHWAPGGLIVLVLLGDRDPGDRAAAPGRGPGAGARSRSGCLAGVHGAQLPLDPVGGRAGGRLGRREPHAAVPARVRAVRLLAPARGERRAAAGRVDAGDDRAGGVRRCCTSTPPPARSLAALFPGGRLDYPSGYPNASAAQWLMAFWPALLLARSGRLPWALRGALAGGAVLLAEVALLSQSRGSLYATPVMLVLVFALLPERMRTFAAARAGGASGIAAAAPAVLRVGDRLHGRRCRARDAAQRGQRRRSLAALAVGLVVALGAAIESRRRALGGRPRGACAGASARSRSPRSSRCWRAAGRRRATPCTRIKHGWDTFKGGYAADNASGSRLVERARQQPLRLLPGGARRIRRPSAGRDRRRQLPAAVPRARPQRTRRPTTRTASSCARWRRPAWSARCWRSSASAPRCWRRARCAPTGARRPIRWRGDVAAAALAGFAYWVVHGSFDWFWEFAGLGAPAFALLGLACCARARAGATAVDRRTAAAGAPARAAPSPAAGRRRPVASAPAPGLLGVGASSRSPRGVARRAVAEPAAGPERGAHLADGAAAGLLPARRRGAA